jgi:hypothetical protein
MLYRIERVKVHDNNGLQNNSRFIYVIEKIHLQDL